MRLAELSAAERTFLLGQDFDDARQAIADGVADSLGKRLGAVLSARLKLQVNLHLQDREPSQTTTNASAIFDDASSNTPRLQWDGILDVWWLNRRLGGRMGNAGAVSPALRKSLARTLEQALAETWLSLPCYPPMPAALAWRMEAAGQTAYLEIHFPPDGTTMKRWAQARIRDVE